jgi:hypothetical protein
MPVSKKYRHKKLASRASCAAGSFRRVKSGKALITVCCPRGKWHGSRCSVGMKAIGLDVKKRRFGEDFPPPRRFKIKLGRRA